jgi:hypothetical protein
MRGTASAKIERAMGLRSTSSQAEDHRLALAGVRSDLLAPAGDDANPTSSSFRQMRPAAD